MLLLTSPPVSLLPVPESETARPPPTLIRTSPTLSWWPSSSQLLPGQRPLLLVPTRARSAAVAIHATAALSTAAAAAVVICSQVDILCFYFTSTSSIRNHFQVPNCRFFPSNRCRFFFSLIVAAFLPIASASSAVHHCNLLCSASLQPPLLFTAATYSVVHCCSFLCCSPLQPPLQRIDMLFSSSLPPISLHLL